jgi:hypothetical protein
MTRAEAASRLIRLLDRHPDRDAQIVGILIVDDRGDLSVSMDTSDDVEILKMGVEGKRKAGPVVVERDLDPVTPTLEVVR